MTPTTDSAPTPGPSPTPSAEPAITARRRATLVTGGLRDSTVGVASTVGHRHATVGSRCRRA
ncbi:MAG: hypothetical protein ABI720_11515, partial [Actinomycetes bacterium]